MNYKEQIKHPKWQKKRLEILERDNYKCQKCNEEEKPLHVHHVWYDNNLMYWEYPDRCYIVLCEKCHELIHKKSNKQDVSMLFSVDTMNSLNNLNEDEISQLDFIIKTIIGFNEDYELFIENLASSFNCSQLIYSIYYHSNIINQLNNVSMNIHLLKDKLNL